MKNTVDCDRNNNGESEDDSGKLGTTGVEAHEMDKLGQYEGDDAVDGSVVDGEDNVSDAGDDHSKDKEIILRRGSDDVNCAEEDAADLDDGQKEVFWGNEAKDYYCQINDTPGDKPRFKKSRFWCCWIHSYHYNIFVGSFVVEL